MEFHFGQIFAQKRVYKQNYQINSANAKIPFFFLLNYSGFGLRSASFSGFVKSVLDLTEKYHGTVYGYVNLFGAIAGFIAPLLTGVITGSDPEDPAKWRIVRTFLEVGISFWPILFKETLEIKIII